MKTQHLHVGLEDLAFAQASVNEQIPELAVKRTAILTDREVQVLVARGGVGVFGDVVFLHRIGVSV